MANLNPDLNLYFAALADPTRRAILERLARGQASATELAAHHDMALPSFMAHLNKLETAGLVSSRKQGRTRYYSLRESAFAPVRGWLEEQATIWGNRLDRLDRYAETLAKEQKQ